MSYGFENEKNVIVCIRNVHKLYKMIRGGKDMPFRYANVDSSRLKSRDRPKTSASAFLEAKK